MVKEHRNAPDPAAPPRNLSRAVREYREKSVEVETDNALERLWRQLDFYGTPPWAGRVGAEIVGQLDGHCRGVWEPACGNGTMAGPIAEYFGVLATDVRDYGYRPFEQFDFLTPGPGPFANTNIDWIITNPPFQHAADFLRLGLERARRGVALLCRLAFLESVGRYQPLYAGPHPMTLCCPFSERVAMRLGPWKPTHVTASAYAWFFFMKGATPRPIQAIPPGTLLRLRRDDDARRFCQEIDAPLFEGVTDGMVQGT